MIEQVKICGKCKETKPISSFSKSKGCYDGLYTYCKACVKTYTNEWYKRNRNKVLAQSAKWYAANREKKSEYFKLNRVHIYEIKRKQRMANPEKYRRRMKQYRIENPESYRAIWKKATRKIRAKNPLATRIRTYISVALQRYKNVLPKKQKSIAYLGCSWDEYKKYIEDRFSEGMTWGLLKSGAIHIDHIRPLSWFNLTNENERMAAFHYSNTQPLWAKDNLIKNNRWAG